MDKEIVRARAFCPRMLTDRTPGFKPRTFVLSVRHLDRSTVLTSFLFFILHNKATQCVASDSQVVLSCQSCRLRALFCPTTANIPAAGNFPS